MCMKNEVKRKRFGIIMAGMFVLGLLLVPAYRGVSEGSRQRTAVVEGYVFGEGNTTIAGALILVNNNNALTYTDNNGYYQLSLPTGMNYSITASAEEYESKTEVIWLSENTSSLQLNFYLQRSSGSSNQTVTIVEGYVFGEGNSTIAGAVILVDNYNVSTYTNPNGYYELFLPAGMNYSITASAEEYESKTEVIWLSENTSSLQLNFYLQRSSGS
ncbi:MAG: carboxypeptidase-like regulatory domain-containing protein, partial [Thermoplasmata archaeon]